MYCQKQRRQKARNHQTFKVIVFDVNGERGGRYMRGGKIQKEPKQ